jgi:hypothetical protein
MVSVEVTSPMSIGPTLRKSDPADAVTVTLPSELAVAMALADTWGWPVLLADTPNPASALEEYCELFAVKMYGPLLSSAVFWVG